MDIKAKCDDGSASIRTGLPTEGTLVFSNIWKQKALISELKTKTEFLRFSGAAAANTINVVKYLVEEKGIRCEYHQRQWFMPVKDTESMQI